MQRMMRLLLGALVLGLAACGALPADAPTTQTSPRLFPVKQNGAWGFIDKTGAVVIEPRFEMAWAFSEDRAMIGADGRYGYIDPTGAVVIEPRFQDAWYFSEGLAPVQIDGKWGFIDKAGAMVVDPQFDLDTDVLEAEPYEPREFDLVKLGERYGFMNEQGQVLINARYDQAWYFADGRARVRIDGKWGYIDREGRTAIEPQFDLAWDFSDDLALVQVAGRYGYIDKQGAYVWVPTD